jgi:hypothetical protein
VSTSGRQPPRVLVYRAIGLGDFLTGVPGYRAVVNAYPDHDVVLAAPAPLGGLADLVGGLAGFVPTAELATPRWSGPQPEVAVDLHGRGPQSHRAVQALNPRRLIGFANAEVDVDGPVWRPDEHEVSRWCRLLRESGIPADEDDLGLAVPAAPPVRSGATLVHPGAAALSRRWPAHRFADVAASLQAQGHEVVVTGSAAERALARDVAARAGLPPGSVLAGCLDLPGLAALVAAARLVVCGDTGVAHVATAYATPSVVLFGPMSPALWGPPTQRARLHRTLWRPPSAPPTSVPAGGVDPALLALTVDDVLREVGEVEALRQPAR